MSAAVLKPYRPSPIRRPRRSPREMEAIRTAIFQVLEQDQPMTVRQVFYRLVSTGVIGKTEAEYKQTIGRLLTEMRRARVIPYGWIADNTRWMRKPDSYRSMSDALQRMQDYYRRDLWANQDSYVEVWLEKDALAGVVFDVTGKWDVPLMVTRGYPSLSFLAEAAEAIAAKDCPCHLYYFGDHDPSGVDIPRHIEKQLSELVRDLTDDPPPISFRVVAVVPDQIRAFDLPTRPTKTTDTRSRGFQGESVEVDAIPPAALRELVDNCITRHIDEGRLERTRAVEAIERETVAGILANLP